jgi:hypothetical protein
MSVLATADLNLAPDVLAAVRKRLETLLFRRPGWWRAWQFSAMSGRELRDASLQHMHLTIEDFSKSKIAFERLTTLAPPFELALFGAPLLGDEPAERPEALESDA